MSTVVRDLRPVENPPEADIVELIEGFLESARRGELVAVAIAAHHRGGEVGTGYTIARGGDGAHLVAALEKLKYRMLIKDHA